MRAGEYVLGVRANSEQIGALLRGIFADRLVPEAEPPGNISVFLAEQTSGHAQERHRLYACHSRTLRTRSVARLLATLWHELDCYDARLHHEGMLLDVTAVVRDGQAHLIPAVLRRQVSEKERSWARDRFEIVDRRWLDLDVATGTVTVTAPQVPGGKVALGDTLVALGVADRTEPAGPTGTFQVASWTVAADPISLAKRVVIAAGAVLDRQQHDVPRMLDDLARLLASLPVVEESWDFVDELRRHLARL